MKFSKTAVEMNKGYEGFFPKAYLCPAGIWTVGYGTTFINGRKVTSSDRMTKEEATAYLVMDMQKHLDGAAKYIKPEIKAQLNQNQIDAITLFTYNLGVGRFSKTPFLQALNAGDFKNCSEKMLQHNKGGGKVLKGLVRRRAEEKALFDKPV